MKNYGGYTYLLSNIANTVLYVGVTNNLVTRIYQHKNNLVEGFTAKYKIHKLVWYEAYERIEDAILREKQLKAGSRKKKIELIEKMNPKWLDLYKDIIQRDCLVVTFLAMTVSSLRSYVFGAPLERECHL